jgi:hypothetical protein
VNLSVKSIYLKRKTVNETREQKLPIHFTNKFDSAKNIKIINIKQKHQNNDLKVP